MANAKEIRDRIDSIRDTQKITNAMYLISSTKMRRAKEELDRTRPYFDQVNSEIRRVFRTAEIPENRYLYQDSAEDSEGTIYGLLVITSDKGLAGAYNQNAIREAERLLGEHPNSKLFVVGEVGHHYFVQRGYPIEKSFLYTAQNPTMRRARVISEYLLQLFEEDKLDKLFVVYTDMKSSMLMEAKSHRLLPFHRHQFAEGAARPDEEASFEFFPSVEAVLTNAMHSYVAGYIYSALVDSFCSEQNSRMTAMKAANDNAEALLGELSLEYNRIRQAAITQEITEVSAGARAQKKKRKKQQTAKEVS